MPPRSQTLPGGILKLTKLLSHLNASPKLSLSGVKKLRLSLASQNDHFGVRHFVKEDLPRIRWANPKLDIEVQREKKAANEHWRAEMEVELENGKVQKVDMQDKQSTTILEELMDLAGGDSWKAHAHKSTAPSIPGKAKEKSATMEKTLPTLEEYLKQNPAKRAEHIQNFKARKPKKEAKASSSSSPSSSSHPPPLLNPFAASLQSSAPPPS